MKKVSQLDVAKGLSKIEIKPKPAFYFRWGNEPDGMVSTGFYNKKEEFKNTGYANRSEVVSLGLPYHCPYT